MPKSQPSRITITFQTSDQRQHNADPRAVSHSNMDWWHKLRRSWSPVPPLLKLGKSLGGVRHGGGGGDGIGGLVKLRDEVEMCGYRDVEVMWNMLRIKQKEKITEGRGKMRVKVKVVKMKAKNSKRSNKRITVWRLLFWTNHSP